MNTAQNITSTFICLLLCVAGCKRAAVSETAVRAHADDSVALSVALGPTLDCLPFYYAEASGIYDTLGLNVDIKSYSAQFDRDTALLGNTADGIFSDLVRTQYHVAQGHNLSGDGHRRTMGCCRVRRFTNPQYVQTEEKDGWGGQVFRFRFL